MKTAHSGNDLSVVLIEWDGMQPSSRWYRRLHRLALRARGNSETSTMTGRDQGMGIIFQEGAIICGSLSLARLIAHKAEDLIDEMEAAGQLVKAHDTEAGTFLPASPSVSIGTLQLASSFTTTRQDAEILQRVEEKLGRRGRPPEASDWAVTCTECAKVSRARDYSPLNCPYCGGLLIHSRRLADNEQLASYADPGGDVVGAWLRLRFAGSHWEPAQVNPDAPKPPQKSAADILSAKDAGIIAAIEESPLAGIVRRMAADDREYALSLLDAVFVNRAYRDQETRDTNRARGAVAYFTRAGKPEAVSLIEEAPDLLDATTILGTAAVAALLLAEYGRSID